MGDLLPSIWKPHLIVVLVMLTLPNDSGCRKDDGSVMPPDSGTPTVGYGHGTITMEVLDGGGHFTADGTYKPSDQFASDTLSAGGGGFLYDTTLFSKSIQGMLAGYTHSFSNGVLTERILIMALHSSAFYPDTGRYEFSRSNTGSADHTAFVYFFLSDSLNFHEVFIAKSGLMTVATLDSVERKAGGSFSGILWSLSDTSRQVEIANGQFELSLANRYFNF